MPWQSTTLPAGKPRFHGRLSAAGPGRERWRPDAR